MSDARIAELEKALRDAVLVALACKSFVDEQGNRYFAGKKPNWKGAALACHDEISDKPDEWADLIGMDIPTTDPSGTRGPGR